MTPEPYPALARLRGHLAAESGRIGEAEAPLAIAVLREYLESGAALGRSLRDELAQFRPSDPVGATLAYLFVITVDGATHDGREGALAAYAASGQPLADAAAQLYTVLASDEFRRRVGRRPIKGGPRGCSGKS